MIGAALRLTDAALQLIGTALIFDIPTAPQMIDAAPWLTGATLQLIGTTLIFDVPPLR